MFQRMGDLEQMHKEEPPRAVLRSTCVSISFLFMVEINFLYFKLLPQTNLVIQLS